MFSTQIGPNTESGLAAFLRPETAQGIFINFKNITDTCRVKIPFGIAQIGKSFRNEIIARQFIFRTREFEQMELEYFCEPGTQAHHFEHWLEYCLDWLRSLSLNSKNLRVREHSKEELSFYSERTVDIEYAYPFGWSELWGIASRTDYDLSQHAKMSSKNLSYFDTEKNKKYIPFVIEPALGLNRLFLSIIHDAYTVDRSNLKSPRVYLRLAPKLAPVKAAVLPLQKKDGLKELARKFYQDLSSQLDYRVPIEYDESGSIGKRYYRQDELGTPFCFTIDYESLAEQSLTLRHRDTGRQERLPLDAKQARLFIEQYL